MAKKKKTDLFSKTGELSAGVKKGSLSKKQTSYRTKLLKRAAEKQRQRALDDPNALTGPLTPRSLAKETESAVKGKFGEKKFGLLDQKALSERNERDVGSWYENYKNDVVNSGAAVQQGYQGAQSAVQGFQQPQGESERIAKERSAQQLAQTTGAPAPQDNEQLARQAQASRGAALGNFGGLLASQGATQGSHWVNKASNASLQKFTEQGKERTHRKKLDNQLGRLAREAGDFRINYRTQAREGERKHSLERAAFGLQTQKAGADAAADAARLQATLRGQDITARGQDISSADRQAALNKQGSGGSSGGGGGSTGGGGGGGASPKYPGVTPTQIRKNRSRWDEILAFARTLPKGSRDYRTVRTALKSQFGTKDDVLQDAASYWASHGGGVTGGLRNKVKKKYPGVVLKRVKKKAPVKIISPI